MLLRTFGSWESGWGCHSRLWSQRGTPSCFSEEVAASCSACSPVGAPVAPMGSLSLLRLGRQPCLAVALLFASRFQAFYLGWLLLSLTITSPFAVEKRCLGWGEAGPGGREFCRLFWLPSHALALEAPLHCSFPLLTVTPVQPGGQADTAYDSLPDF